MNKETLYKVGVIASAVCIGLVAYQTGKPDEFYKRHEAYASERPNRFFWSVDRNYYVMDIPEGKENDEKWRSFMNWQERALTFDENAILLVGSSYQLGVPVGQNDDAAAYWFKLAADRFGNPDAMYNYAIIAADKGNRKTYTNYLIQAAEKGNTPAMNEIARSVLERRNQKDSVIYKEGRRYAEISASKKSPIGTLLFANYLYNERDKKAADVLARIDGKPDMDSIRSGIDPREIKYLKYGILADIFGGSIEEYDKYLKQHISPDTMSGIEPLAEVGVLNPINPKENKK